MYICLCNGYRDAEIREVAESGVRCVREVYLTLGNGPCCGTCLDCAQDIVDDVHGVASAAPAAEEPAGQDDEAPLMAAE
ncbi:MAG: bacterioferritin [Kiloniellaceae bacterium]|nr:bacterioferritin [Kiloniellaceae bacterium]